MSETSVSICFIYDLFTTKASTLSRSTKKFIIYGQGKLSGKNDDFVDLSF